MFVPVACSQCGKPFQVPESAVGSPTVCPWCQATVPALPVGKPAGASPSPPRPEPEPLPLEDTPPPAEPARPFPWWVAGAALLLLAVAAVLTVVILQRNREKALHPEWQLFAPADGSFRVELPGPVTEEAAAGGGRRFVAEHAGSGLTAWVAWADLTPVQVQLADTDEAWKLFIAPFDAERDRLKKQFGGTVTREATTKFKDPLTREMRIDYDGGRLVERMTVLAKGPHPRAYFVGIAGKIDPDGPEAKRLFDSFKVSE
jgi:hypothetical protein